MDKHTDHDDVEPLNDSTATDAGFDTGTGAHAASRTDGTTADHTGTEQFASDGDAAGVHTDDTLDGGPSEHDARASLADLDDPGHLFDQTNGLAGDTLGESDGTVDGELTSAGERGGNPDVDPGTDAGTGRVAFNPDDRI